MFSSEEVEKFKSIQTPFYYYDLGLLNETLKMLKEISSLYEFKIHYALKANANPRILHHIQSYGFGADCVSGNEVRRALEVGFPPEEIVYAGVGKTDQEIQYALENNIQSLNCESIQELEVINSLAKKLGKIANIALRINPKVEADTHEYITTGLEENKFGITLNELKLALRIIKDLNHLKLIGLHFHIGSQILDMDSFKNLCKRVNEVQQKYFQKKFIILHLNLGGGLGVDHRDPDKNIIPDFRRYFLVFKNYLKYSANQIIHFELGRSVVAQCGTLVCQVLYVKKGLHSQFVIINAGMTELIRPALYQSYHHIENLTSTGPAQVYDVVGPVCESSDFLGKSVTLPETRRGDLIAIRTTGAYAEVMSSRYNLRDPARAVYSDEL